MALGYMEDLLEVLQMKKNDTNCQPTGVAHDMKIFIKKSLDEFLMSSHECLTFPPNLSKAARKFAHTEARKLGILSRSAGKNEKRQLTLYKKLKTVKLFMNDNSLFSPHSRAHIGEFLKYNQCPNVTALNSYQSNNSKNLSVWNSLNRCVPPKSNAAEQMLKMRKLLPIFDKRKEIVESIWQNRVTIINGDTGSGKTTQVPQYLLEDALEKGLPCRMLCTLPKRFAVTSTADRVAKERGESLGTVVGYQIRLEGCYRNNTNLIYTTSGCMLRYFMTGGKTSLHGITHAIIDEIHERDKNTDFLLIALRDFLNVDPNFKIVLMSATMDIMSLQNYFNNCSIIRVPGRCYSTKVYFLENILEQTRPSIHAQGVQFGCNSTNTTTTTTTVVGEIEKFLSKEKTDDRVVYLIDKIIEKSLSSASDAEIGMAFGEVLFCVDNKKIPVDVQHTRTKKTMLIAVAERNLFELLEKLLEYDPDTTVRDINGRTALDYAKMHGDMRCAERLNSYIMSTKFTLEMQSALYRYESTRDPEEIDHGLIIKLIKNIHESGFPQSILVFLPGYSDLMLQKDEIQTHLSRGSYELFILHSNMKMEDQKRVLQPTRHRKIILATDIAETSITFDEVAFIIDSGKVKQNTYETFTGCSYLKTIWISKSVALQRSGRAGRTQNGICYRLYSRQQYESMNDFTLPEFVRIPLTEICLFAKALNNNTSISEYLSKALEPPTELNVANAIFKLKIVGAIDEDEEITEMGRRLVDMPLDVQLGKALLLSVMFRCLDPVLTIVSYLSVKDPNILPSNHSERGQAASVRRYFCGDHFSDHAGIINTYVTWCRTRSRRASEDFCAENYLSRVCLEMIRAVRLQLLENLRRMGLYNGSDHDNQRLNANAKNWSLVKACLTAGLYPNVAFIDRVKQKLTSRLESSAVFHQSSILHRANLKQTKREMVQYPTEWVVFNEKLRFKTLTQTRYNSLVTPCAIAIFCGPILPFDYQITPLQGFNSERNLLQFAIDDWLMLNIDEQETAMLAGIRRFFGQVFIQFLNNNSSIDVRLIDNFVNLLANILNVEETLIFGDKNPLVETVKPSQQSQSSQSFQSYRKPQFQRRRR